MSYDMWNDDEPLADRGLDIPDWISQDITPCDVAAIVQGGCASGAYMPAVTYSQAAETMAKHGDAVLTFLEQYDSLPTPPEGSSWSGIGVFYLSYGVELWASSAEGWLEDNDGGLEEEE